jgi:hypothetical protein
MKREKLGDQEVEFAETIEEAFELIERQRKRLAERGVDSCSGCGALHGGPAHRCPQAHPCATCGAPADDFIADPTIHGTRQLFDADAFDAALDFMTWPICTDCLQKLIARHWQKLQ